MSIADLGTGDLPASRRDRVSDVKVSADVYEAVAALARRRRSTMAAIVREAVMPLVHLEAAPALPGEELRTFLAEHPEALCYRVPGASILAARGHEAGDQDAATWRGLICDPARAGTLAAWSSTDPSAPLWARRPSIARALAVVASRVDEDDGSAYFRVPRSKYVVRARWGGARWDDGEVLSLDGSGFRETWLRGASSAVMAAGSKAGRMPNVRRVLTMLAAATIGMPEAAR